MSYLSKSLKHYIHVFIQISNSFSKYLTLLVYDVMCNLEIDQCMSEVSPGSLISRDLFKQSFAELTKLKNCIRHSSLTRHTEF